LRSCVLFYCPTRRSSDLMDILDLWYGEPLRGLRGSFSHPDYQELIDGAGDEVDEQKRLDMLIEAERLMIEDEGTLGPLYFEGRADRKSTRLNSSHVSISY